MLALRLIDGFSGQQAENAPYEIAHNEAGDWRIVSEGKTNAEGCAILIPAGDEFRPGYYELTLFLGEYFRYRAYPLSGRKFVDIVPVRFGIDEVDLTTEITMTIGPNGYTVSRMQQQVEIEVVS